MARKKKEETVVEAQPVVEAPVEEVAPVEVQNETAPAVEILEEEGPANVEVLEDQAVEATVENTLVEQEVVQAPVVDEPLGLELTVKAADRSAIGQVKLDNMPEIECWWTTMNDTKRRYNPGVFTNTQTGVFGTIRVLESGMVEFVKHSDWEKRIGRMKKNSEEFQVKLVSEEHGVLSVQTVKVTLEPAEV